VQIVSDRSFSIPELMGQKEDLDAKPAGESSAFKGYKDAWKILRSFQPPISEETRNDYLKRVRSCSSSRYIAFRLLALRALGEMQSRLAPFLSDLEVLLHQNEAPLDLRAADSVVAVKSAIADRFSGTNTKDEWKQFFITGRHFPVLYGIVRLWDDPVRFQAAVDALAKALESPTKRKSAKTVASVNNLETVARALIARVPEKPGVGKSLPELAKISRALFRQSEDTNRENIEYESTVKGLNAELESLTNQLATETSGKKEAEKENQELRGKLDRTRAELNQEKEQFETLKAHSEEERNQAVQDVVARLRTDISRALENISLFADREQPNRQGILASVSEIKRALDAAGK
jgi:hypothetical protein